ncbi:hypothetical protein LNV09_17505 [Paucibacter sp. B2R-40]|uniref:hypothetical protein n=1 Tax=Paucibacter sp. B2R-40 TaxID=2893554 RepID=UPI0021E3B2EA|nr:hypothetical protein [Paucibacter sp. B2R-40]MCV2355941.1 hypothetical protein [Paucibacter sp. B2R-40]
MAFIEARSGGPPDAPVSASMPCELAVPRAYLTVQVRNHHAPGTPVLAHTPVRLDVGPQQHTQPTDANGLITFVYDTAADFANLAVNAELTDPSRLWVGQSNTGLLTQLTVIVAGQFQISVEVYTEKPGIGLMAWPHAWTVGLNLALASTPPGGAPANAHIAFAANGAAPPADEINNHLLDCASAHQLTVPFIGFLPNSTVELWTEGNPRAVGPLDAAADDATYRTIAANGIRLQVTRRGATLRVRFVFRFPQVMIVGEGTHFEYATGLASKYRNALANPAGLRWVVATQYDVTPILHVSNHLNIRHWQTNVWINNANQRQRVQTALTENLVNHGVQFDATNAGHWNAALLGYGAFDAVVFNNPHPGYGLHMCEVMGLSAQGGVRFKNGKAISVYSFGYGVALTVLARAPFVNHGQPTHYATQFDFVRGNGGGALNHQNLHTDAVNLQFAPAHTTPMALTIAGAFRYADGQAIDPAWYGIVGEMPADSVDHYRSNVNTVGLQGYLMRCYRYHGPQVLKPGGWLFVNGSNSWNAMLTAGYSIHHAGANHAVPGMTNLASWPTHASYFVHYRTNFTSTDHHPSWYSDPAFNPHEPNINNARAYGRQY